MLGEQSFITYSSNDLREQSVEEEVEDDVESTYADINDELDNQPSQPAAANLTRRERNRTSSKDRLKGFGPGVVIVIVLGVLSLIIWAIGPMRTYRALIFKYFTKKS